MKIYTKGGDSGSTSLVGGTRTAKDDVRVEAYGTIDELGAHVGYLHSLLDIPQKDELVTVMRTLMNVGTLIAAEELSLRKLPQVSTSDIEFLEKSIDAMMSQVPNLKSFTLPAGSGAYAYANVCRTVCRRAERCIVTARGAHPGIPEIVAVYTNRLSDYLYALGRYVAVVQQTEVLTW